jgi:hypothetical protein
MRNENVNSLQFCLSGRCADDEPCEYFQEETDPEEPGNNKD